MEQKAEHELQWRNSQHKITADISMHGQPWWRLALFECFLFIFVILNIVIGIHKYVVILLSVIIILNLNLFV